MRLLLLTLLAGCGFLGEDPYAGVRVEDVSPWQDEGPIVVCDGTRVLAPPATAPVGFCAAADKPCAAARDCASRETCICGQCALVYCDSATPCPSGFACATDGSRCERKCTADGDCAHGEHCVDGRHVCRGDCSVDDDCQRGERCDLATSTCAGASCSDDSACKRGACAIERTPASLSEPSPLVENGGVTLWLERDGAIWRARSSDGRHFALDPPRALLMGHAPSVAHDTQYVLAYGDGAQVVLATSSDGVSFAAPAATVDDAAEPSLLAADGQWSLYFARGGELLRATGDSPSTLSAAATVLTPDALTDPTLWRDVDRIASPFAERRFDAGGHAVVRLWFAARGTESAAAFNFGAVQATPPNFSVGEAASSDGQSFVPYPFNPVFDRTTEFINHPSELDPAVIRFVGEQLLYYRRAAADGSGSQNLAVAHNPARPRN
jgi:hypothetical protein